MLTSRLYGWQRLIVGQSSTLFQDKISKQFLDKLAFHFLQTFMLVSGWMPSRGEHFAKDRREICGSSFTAIIILVCGQIPVKLMTRFPSVTLSCTFCFSAINTVNMVTHQRNITLALTFWSGPANNVCINWLNFIYFTSYNNSHPSVSKDIL